jgi:actin related protein 2/3 complex subunit 2
MLTSDSHFRPGALDVQFVDYDGVRFRLSTPEKKTVLLLSMSIRCWDELVRFGANDVIKREYGNWVKAETEPDYNVSLEFDTDKIPPAGGKSSTHLQA